MIIHKQLPEKKLCKRLGPIFDQRTEETKSCMFIETAQNVWARWNQKTLQHNNPVQKLAPPQLRR